MQTEMLLPKGTVILTEAGARLTLSAPLACEQVDDTTMQVTLRGRVQTIGVIKLGTMTARQWAAYYASR